MASAGLQPSIVTSPRSREGTSAIHPRRPPPNRSVSLRHSPWPIHKNQGDSSSDTGSVVDERPMPNSAAAGTDLPSSLLPSGGKMRSGESSNAEKWFEESNNEVRENSASFADNEPPFFMRNDSSSSETPPNAQRPQVGSILADDHTNLLSPGAGLLQLGTDGTSADDFRSVIDDLTIQNKKLKRKLKKYEKLHDSHLKDEKLFEVRIHGLPAEKKRELEETLRKFTSNLNPPGANAFPPDGYSGLLPMLKPSKTASSQASFHHADSAYASMSGQGSIAHSGSDGKRKYTPTQYLSARQKNIHSYLHHIPEGLMPQQNPATLNERSRKKLVVRRMEQLFAGKGAAEATHQQSHQQQEVSQTAARMDRSEIEASGQAVRKEGVREAYIMDQETEDPLDLAQNSVEQSSEKVTSQERLEKRNIGQEFASGQSPMQPVSEQRPTRPLDLDPNRAQVPVENVRYMQQMGFSPPEPGSDKSPEEGHGWIYLNFLINMAQLHTIHVTSEFVRKALTECSNKFEVSDDGRKVRWRGNSYNTRASSNGAASSYGRVGSDTDDGESPRKRPKLTQQSCEQSKVTGSFTQDVRTRTETNKYIYTPLFNHRDSANETDDSSSEEEEDSTLSPQQVPVAGDSSGMASSGVRTTLGRLVPSRRKKQKREDGPIIFYNNARFCTDLSGDQRANGSYDDRALISASTMPINQYQSFSSNESEKRGPLAYAAKLPEPMDLNDNPIPESMELSFPPTSPLEGGSSHAQKPIDLDVTGIGGVWPADNFAITVESRQARFNHLESSRTDTAVLRKSLPSRLAPILQASVSEHRNRPQVQKQIIESKVQELPPSELPPAISFLDDEDESLDDDDDSGMDDNASDVSESPSSLPPAAAPQPLDIQYAWSEEDEEYTEDEEDEESDGEVDFLAAARELNPEAVRQKEREYDANMAERLAEDIPAGSSAATAGGGSGFNSPGSNVDKVEYHRAMLQVQERPSLQHAQTSDIMVVEGTQDLSSSGSDNLVMK